MKVGPSVGLINDDVVGFDVVGTAIGSELGSIDGLADGSAVELVVVRWMRCRLVRRTRRGSHRLRPGRRMAVRAQGVSVHTHG